MNKQKIKTVASLALACVVALSACTKVANQQAISSSTTNNQRPINPTPGPTPPPPPPFDLWQGFHAFQSTSAAGLGNDGDDNGSTDLKTIDFRTPGAWTQGTDYILYGLVGANVPAAATDVKCYGEFDGMKAVAFTEAATGRTILWSSGSSTIAVTYQGQPLHIEEIEINPDNSKIYALASNGTGKSLFVIEGPGEATLVNYQLSDGVTISPYIFNHYALNGYKSGSIAFVQNTPDPTQGHHLAYTTESTVYSTQGVLVWNFLLNEVAGNPAVISANAIFPNTNYNNLPNPQTGNINTVSLNGILYFARDNATLYQLNGTNSITPIGTGNLVAANDFGPKTI